MKRILAYILFLLLPSVILGADIKFSPIFTDNMVVQRDAEVKIYGVGTPSTPIILTCDGREYYGMIQADSSWQFMLPPFQLYKKYSLTVTSDNVSLTLNNIVSGDVWIASGQSNMEFEMKHFSWCDAEIAKTNDSLIRFYTVPNDFDLIPLNHLPEGGKWNIAMGETLKQSSAVAYFFARNLKNKLPIPIGIICSEWGGTALEPWMSKEAIAPFPQFAKDYAELTINTKNKNQIEREFSQLRKTWDNEYYLTGKGIEEKWFQTETDFSNWQPYKPLNGYWEKNNIELDNYDGSIWFKTTFDLPQDYTGSDYTLHLSYIKDYNTTWVNGEKVGEVFGHQNWTKYTIPEKILKPKGNVLVVRVMNVEGNGGFNYPPSWGNDILNSAWVFKTDEPLKTDFVKPNIINVTPYSHPTILYNAMISPLTHIKTKGVIWYQGESNSDRGYEYRTLFPAMIKDWREKFNNPSMPFYFVQLANFEAVDTTGNNNDWAELRESQHLTSQLTNTGMASAIDLGEEGDIHPSNKQGVGRRLALLAFSDCYKIQSRQNYPQIDKMRIANGKIYVSTTCKVNIVNGEKKIKGFAIAGADKKFYPAEASFVNGEICISSPNVKNPQAVRYAWAKNPGNLNLYGDTALPLLPYRSDSWKGKTEDNTYKSNTAAF